SQRRALLSALPLFRVPLDYLLGDLLGGGFDLLERPCFARDALALVGRSAPFALRAEAATPAAVELGEGAGGALTGETLGVSGASLGRHGVKTRWRGRAPRPHGGTAPMRRHSRGRQSAALRARRRRGKGWGGPRPQVRSRASLGPLASPCAGARCAAR